MESKLIKRQEDIIRRQEIMINQLFKITTLYLKRIKTTEECIAEAQTLIETQSREIIRMEGQWENKQKPRGRTKQQLNEIQNT